MRSLDSPPITKSIIKTQLIGFVRFGWSFDTLYKFQVLVIHVFRF